MASLTKQGKYYKIVFTDRNRDKQQKAIYQPVSLSKRHAKKLKTKLEKFYERGEYDPWKDDYKSILSGQTTDIKVKDVIDEYLSYKSQHDWIESTAKKCKYLFYNFIDQQDIKYEWIDEVDIQHFNSYINRADDISARTRKYYKRNFKAFIKYLNHNGYSDINDSKLKVYKKNQGYKRKKKYFEPSEIKEICKKIDEKVKSDMEKGYQNKNRNSLWLKDFIWWQVLSGMRLNETLSIKVRNVDLENGYVKIYNQKAKRLENFKINGNEKLVEIAKKYVDDASSKDDLLFQHSGGKRVSKNFKKYLKLALPDKSDYNQHCLRHSCCIWLIRSNMNLVKVKEYMRHANIETTMEYAGLVEDDYADEAGEVFNNIVQ